MQLIAPLQIIVIYRWKYLWHLISDFNYNCSEPVTLRKDKQSLKKISLYFRIMNK